MDETISCGKCILNKISGGRKIILVSCVGKMENLSLVQTYFIHDRA